jgi:hypothetical protein
MTPSFFLRLLSFKVDDRPAYDIASSGMAQNADRSTNNNGGECRKAERQEVFRVWLSAIGWTATAVFWKFILLQRGGNAGRIQAAADAKTGN